MAMEEGSSSGLEQACEALTLDTGDEGVVVEVEEEESPPVDYRFTAVGRVASDRNIKFVVFRDVMATAWRPFKGVHITELGDRFLFRFFHENDIARVVAEGPWTFEQNLVVLRRLEEGDDPATVDLDMSSFWIQVHNLPSGFMSEKVAKAIGDSVGVFEAADPRNFEGVRKSFMRVRVKLNVQKPLKPKMKLKKPGAEWF